MHFDKNLKQITLTPDDISDEVYSALDEAFSAVLKDHGIDDKKIFWETWYLTATYTEEV